MLHQVAEHAEGLRREEDLVLSSPQRRVCQVQTKGIEEKDLFFSHLSALTNLAQILEFTCDFAPHYRYCSVTTLAGLEEDAAPAAEDRHEEADKRRFPVVAAPGV